MIGRNPVHADISRVDRELGLLSRVPACERTCPWVWEVDLLLGRRLELMAERDRGFRITNRRRMRG